VVLLNLKSSIFREVSVCLRSPKAVLFHLAKFLLEALAMLIMIRNLTVTLIWTVVLQRSWYQVPGCSVQ